MNIELIYKLDDILSSYDKTFVKNNLEELLNDDKINNLLETIFEDVEEITTTQVNSIDVSRNLKKLILLYLRENGYIKNKSKDDIVYTDLMTSYMTELRFSSILDSEEQKELLMKQEALRDELNLLKNIIIGQYYLIMDTIAKKYINDYIGYNSILKFEIDIIAGLIDKNVYYENENELYKYLEKEVIKKCKYTISKKTKIVLNKNYDPKEIINVEKIDKKDIKLYFEEYNNVKNERDKTVKYIAEHNLKLVIPIAKQYLHRGLDYIDLIQEGNIGLIRAIERFETAKGASLSTYANHWINQYMIRAIADKSRIIRFSNQFHDRVVKVNYVINQYFKENGELPDDKYIKEKTNFSLDVIKEIQKLNVSIISLNGYVGERKNGVQTETADFVEDTNVNIEEEATNNLINDNLYEALEKLSDKEKGIILMRFGFIINDPVTFESGNNIILLTSEKIDKNNIYSYLENKGLFGELNKLKNMNYNLIYQRLTGKEMTLEQIGVNLGVTRERIRQIEAKALRKLKVSRDAKKLQK